MKTCQSANLNKNLNGILLTQIIIFFPLNISMMTQTFFQVHARLLCVHSLDWTQKGYIEND